MPISKPELIARIDSLANKSQNDKEIKCLRLLQSILIKNIELELAVENPNCLLQEFVENKELQELLKDVVRTKQLDRQKTANILEKLLRFHDIEVVIKFLKIFNLPDHTPPEGDSSCAGYIIDPSPKALPSILPQGEGDLDRYDDTPIGSPRGELEADDTSKANTPRELYPNTPSGSSRGHSPRGYSPRGHSKQAEVSVLPASSLPNTPRELYPNTPSRSPSPCYPKEPWQSENYQTR